MVLLQEVSPGYSADSFGEVLLLRIPTPTLQAAVFWGKRERDREMGELLCLGRGDLFTALHGFYSWNQASFVEPFSLEIYQTPLHHAITDKFLFPFPSTTFILHSHLFFNLLQMLSPIYLYIYIRKLTSLGSRKRTQHSPRNRPTRATHPERFWHIRLHFCREIRLSVWLRLCMN